MKLDFKPSAHEATETSEPNEAILADTRFQRLLPAQHWAALPADVRRRFSKHVADGQTILYAGEVVEAKHSRLGWLFAQLARLIGAPLPLTTDTGVPAIVTVTEDCAGEGQNWTRIYARKNGFPQAIHTAKRFRGRTGLEEYLGRGFGMALTVGVEDGAIVFRSAGYVLEIFGRQWRWPDILSPGAVTVTHADAGGGRFSFTLTVIHKRFGLLVHQKAVFREVES